jgi:hypothetical protein
VIDDLRTDVTKTRKDGTRGRLRYDYGEHRGPRAATTSSVMDARSRQARWPGKTVLVRTMPRSVSVGSRSSCATRPVLLPARRCRSSTCTGTLLQYAR